MPDVRYAKFKLKDLFEASNGDTDIKKSDLDGQGLPVVTSGVANYGIAGWSSVAAREFDTGTITVDMFGNVMYRSAPYKMVTHARVFSLALKDDYLMSEQVGLYLVGALSKLTEGYGFNDMCSWSKICDKSILLPAMTVDEPDWDYMTERIAELEAERIAELEAYLVATGLDDCELTDEDKRVLSLSRKSASDEDGCSAADAGLRWKEFKVGELFELINNPQLDKRNFVFDESAEYPYFTRTENNNGVLGYVRYLDDKHKIPGNSLAVGMISMRFHYMPHDFYAGQFTKTLLPKFDEFDEQLALYFIAELNARSGYYQGYLVREFATRVLETELELPVTSAGTPDWDYMRAYIRAQEKLVMAGVADMTQKRIDATREIVEA